MVEWSDPAAQRWLIGAELRHYRQQAGHTAASASKAIGCTGGKINHLESGRNRQQPQEVVGLLEYYGVKADAIKRMTELAERADQRTWWSPWAEVVPEWFQPFVGMEGCALGEFLYEPVLVPGLLQTEAYARAVTSATPRVRPDHVHKFVEFRMARTRMLRSAEPLMLKVVIGEAALRLDVGDDVIMREQYAHLREMARLPHVSLQVLCPENGVHSGFTGAFAILSFEHAHSVGYIEMQDDAAYISDQDRLRGYELAAQDLRDTALSVEESLHMIEKFLRYP